MPRLSMLLGTLLAAAAMLIACGPEDNAEVAGESSSRLSRTAAQDVIRGVGNYGEIYDRHLGDGGIGLPREGGRNALWADAPCQDCPKGGQIYAAP